MLLRNYFSTCHPLVSCNGEADEYTTPSRNYLRLYVSVWVCLCGGHNKLFHFKCVFPSMERVSLSDETDPLVKGNSLPVRIAADAQQDSTSLRH